MSGQSSHRGSGHWWGQRLTAVALVVLGLWFLASIVLLQDLQFGLVSIWISIPTNLTLMILTFATIVYHSKLGVQVVIEDYVHGPSIQVFSLRANMLAHAILAVTGLYALLKIGFGG